MWRPVVCCWRSVGPTAGRFFALFSIFTRQYLCIISAYATGFSPPKNTKSRTAEPRRPGSAVFRSTFSFSQRLQRPTRFFLFLDEVEQISFCYDKLNVIFILGAQPPLLVLVGYLKPMHHTISLFGKRCKQTACLLAGFFSNGLFNDFLKLPGGHIDQIIPVKRIQFSIKKCFLIFDRTIYDRSIHMARGDTFE